MSNETATSTLPHDISSDTIDLSLGQDPEKDSKNNGSSNFELIFKSVDNQIKQATDPSPRQVKELC